MRSLFLIWILVLGMLCPSGAQAQETHHKEVPTEGANEGVVFIEMAVWSTQGAPTITANVMGTQRTQKTRLTDVGVYSATFKVPHSRLLPVSLRIDNGPVTEDLVVVHHADHRVSWILDDRGDFLRSSSPISQHRMAIQEAMVLAGGALWIILVGWFLVSGRLERGGRALTWRVPEPVWLLFWLGLSVAWTWPACLSNNVVVVGRHFDTPGTLWVIGTASRLFSSIDPMTAVPLGADLTRLDSYLLLPISRVFESLGPGRIFGWLTIVGVALNAWAAQHFARAVGAKSPWTILAGVGFGFCGLAATGLLEGHIYQVFNPWLPWFGAALWRSSAEDGTPRQAVLAAALFVLCWLTTAYVGVVALGLAVVVLWLAPQRPKPLLGGMAVFLSVYVLWYLSGDAASRESLEGLNPMSAHLGGLLAATPEIDRAEHSMAPIIYGWMLGLVVMARSVLGGGRWTALMVAGGGAVLMSLTPGFAASPEWVLIPANLNWVPAPVAALLRFPIRFAWLWSLCGGVLAAVVATRLAPKWGRWGWLVLIVVFAEAFIRVGTPYRTEYRYIEAPSQLTQQPGPILEMLPVTDNRGVNWDRWLANFSCIEQLSHGQAIAEDCIHTKPRKLRSKLNVWLQDRLLSEQTEGVEATLAALGFKTVMVRPDLFTNRHAELFIDQLKAVDPRPTRVSEKGVYSVMYTVTGEASPDPRAVLADLQVSERPQVSRRNWQGAIHHGRYNGPVAVVSWLIIGAVLLVTRRRRS